MDVKSQLYSYYIDILNEISSLSDKYPSKDFSSMTISDLILEIKESSNFLFNAKTSKIISLNKNAKNYYQLENYVKKIEYDLKNYIKKFYEYKIQNDALEEKIKIYRIMQEEFEDLKEKVKYEGGRFLENERKDNEIIILRNENSILKKEIIKFEKLNTLNETLKKDYQIKINYLQNEIDHLNKKILEYQESNINNNNKTNKNIKSENIENINIISNNNNNNNQNINNKNNSIKYNKYKKALINLNNISNKENILLKRFAKLEMEDINNINNILINRAKKNLSLNYKKNIKNINKKNNFLTNKRPSNYNIIKKLYMNSNNSIKYNPNINSSSMSTVNTNNVFTCNYNKIIGNMNRKNSRHSLKKSKKSGNKNHQRKCNSISMKLDKDENRSFSANKFIKSNNDKYTYKSDRKKINTIQFDKIKIFKYNIGDYPLSCKHKNTTSKINKFKSKKIGLNYCWNEIKTKKNNSALNIRINSK